MSSEKPIIIILQMCFIPWKQSHSDMGRLPQEPSQTTHAISLTDSMTKKIKKIKMEREPQIISRKKKMFLAK